MGAAIAIFLLAYGRSRIGLPMLVPSFASSCALVFALPENLFARPLSVIGGHLVSSVVGLVTLAALGSGPLGVGSAISLMMLTRTMHPPAGGDPLIVMLTAAPPSFLIAPMLIGSITVVLVGICYHQLTRGHYPLH